MKLIYYLTFYNYYEKYLNNMIDSLKKNISKEGKFNWGVVGIVSNNQDGSYDSTLHEFSRMMMDRVLTENVYNLNIVQPNSVPSELLNNDLISNSKLVFIIISLIGLSYFIYKFFYSYENISDIDSLELSSINNLRTFSDYVVELFDDLNEFIDVFNQDVCFKFLLEKYSFYIKLVSESNFSIDKKLLIYDSLLKYTKEVILPDITQKNMNNPISLEELTQLLNDHLMVFSIKILPTVDIIILANS